MKKSIIIVALLLSYSVSFCQEFPSIDETKRIELLNPPKGKIKMVLDTDTYNEVDDQFALAYALLSPDKIEVEAVYAVA